MKKILILAMFCLSQIAFAEEEMCVKDKAELDTSLGTYKFVSIEYCQMVYKKLKSCKDGNVLLYEQGKPRVECSDILQGLIDSGSKNLVKVSDQ